LNEILRVVKVNGEVLIYVWAKTQKLDDVKSCYAQKQDSRDVNAPSRKCLTPITTPNYSFLPVHSQELDGFTHNDLLVPWLTNERGGNSGNTSQVHHRFYHVFSQGELDDLIKDVSPRPIIEESYYDQGNWCVRLRKT